MSIPAGASHGGGEEQKEGNAEAEGGCSCASRPNSNGLHAVSRPSVLAHVIQILRNFGAKV